MKYFFYLVCYLTLSLHSYSQNYKEQYAILIKKQDTASLKKLLSKWEKEKPIDAEMFIGFFNYYALKSKSDIISLNNIKPNKESLVATNEKTKEKIYISSNKNYNNQILNKGFSYIDRAIKLYPKRLDMIFGKIFMLGDMENYSQFTNEIILAIELAHKTKYDFTWKNNEPLKDAEAFFLGSLQSYIGTIYNTEKDDLLPLMRKISEAVLKYHTTHIESLSNVALTYMINLENDKALPYLLKAEDINEKDVIVLNNIAVIYKAKKDYTTAKLYFEKIIKYGNDEDKIDAKEKIKNMEK
jgi:tetratricopeptide (TPR) repeat protein